MPHDLSPSRASKIVLAVFLAMVALPDTRVWACLWDYDTLMMERARFPDTLELITGKFRRHSTEFYQWRIRDRLLKLESEPENLAWLDDLAVAYDKTGQHAKAIETMARKESIQPGLYETAANLGTFHIHAGELEKGLEHIRRAIEINPDAHFGREVYQQLLVEYVLECRKAGRGGLPLAGEDPGFVSFLYDSPQRKELSQIDSETGMMKALTGIQGMMRFGHHDSPILLEVLGELLSSPRGLRLDDAKRLAARAYLRASDEVEDETARAAYRQRAVRALSMQTVSSGNWIQLQLSSLEATFRDELAQAENWFEEVHSHEIAWIAEGKDADAEFSRVYYQEPVVSTSLWTRMLQSANPRYLIVGSVIVLLFSIWWRIRRRAA